MNRPKTLDKRYGWCRKKNHGMIIFKEEGCTTCKTEQRRKKEGQCCAILFHGPGHQSKTYCQVKGKHIKHKGRIVHRARYGCYDQIMEWHGTEGFTGFFDEPNELD